MRSQRGSPSAGCSVLAIDLLLVTFGGADHAFFNDTGARFDAPAAAEAWRRTLSWFDAHGRGHDHDEDDD